MTAIFEKFYDEIEEVLNANHTSTMDISDDSFKDNASCECISEGSDAYFDSRMEQWYPGDDPEFEVGGYDDYVEDIVSALVSIITYYYDCAETDELVSDVRDNLEDIMNGDLLNESEYEDRAIENYEEY